MIKINNAAVVVATMVLTLLGCQQATSPKSTPSPANTTAISDGSPYLCELVPENALRQLTGLSGELLTGWDGPKTDNGLCLVHSPGVQPSPLGLEWSYSEGRRILEEQRHNYRFLLHPLPKDLGEGFTASGGTSSLAGRPNYVIALFHCGARQPWLRMDLIRFTPGRDPIKDLTDLMRIAEQRFGKLHQCAPMPI